MGQVRSGPVALQIQPGQFTNVQVEIREPYAVSVEPGEVGEALREEALLRCSECQVVSKMETPGNNRECLSNQSHFYCSFQSYLAHFYCLSF